jgi:hypothetical protein
MPRKKKASFVPKKKQTLVPEPNWERLSKAKTQDAMYKAFIKVADFVHYEVPEREQIHWLKKWIREESGWDLHEETKILPDVHMMAFAKWGWIAIKLGFAPDKVVDSLTRNLKPVLESASELKEKIFSEPPIHPSLLELDDDAKLHPNKVKEWISVWKTYVNQNRKNADSNDWKLRLEYQTAISYVSNMNIYLKSGIWLDSHFGEKREHKIIPVSLVRAYDENGLIKRNKGVYYPDIQRIWGTDET